MEDTLWVLTDKEKEYLTNSLNPYSNGRYSLSGVLKLKEIKDTCLNPYSNGRYSLSKKLSDYDKERISS